MQPVDYMILLGYVAATLVIGGLQSKRSSTATEFFMAARSMHWFPLGLSVMVTAFSAVNYIAFSGEVFGHGLYVLLSLPVFAMIALPVTRVIMPFYHRLGVCSIYEYLEKRFDARVRMLASGMFIVWRLFWIATVLYFPAVVLSSISGFPAASVCWRRWRPYTSAGSAAPLRLPIKSSTVSGARCWRFL